MCDKVKEEEKGGHVARMGVDKCKQDFGGETWREDVTWETQA